MEMYPVEVLGEDDDNGTMVKGVAELTSGVVGHKITGVKVIDNFKYRDYDWQDWETSSALEITLDNGTAVYLEDVWDCCAETTLKDFLFNADKVDHVITGVGTTNGYTTWHIFADFGDVLSLNLDWSCGNPFYYAYGFKITVSDAPLRDGTVNQ